MAEIAEIEAKEVRTDAAAQCIQPSEDQTKLTLQERLLNSFRKLCCPKPEISSELKTTIRDADQIQLQLIKDKRNNKVTQTVDIPRCNQFERTSNKDEECVLDIYNRAHSLRTQFPSDTENRYSYRKDRQNRERATITRNLMMDPYMHLDDTRSTASHWTTLHHICKLIWKIYYLFRLRECTQMEIDNQRRSISIYGMIPLTDDSQIYDDSLFLGDTIDLHGTSFINGMPCEYYVSVRRRSTPAERNFEEQLIQIDDKMYSFNAAKQVLGNRIKTKLQYNFVKLTQNRFEDRVDVIKPHPRYDENYILDTIELLQQRETSHSKSSKCSIQEAYSDDKSVLFHFDKLYSKVAPSEINTQVHTSDTVTIGEKSHVYHFDKNISSKHQNPLVKEHIDSSGVSTENVNQPSTDKGKKHLDCDSKEHKRVLRETLTGVFDVLGWKDIKLQIDEESRSPTKPKRKSLGNNSLCRIHIPLVRQKMKGSKQKTRSSFNSKLDVYTLLRETETRENISGFFKDELVAQSVHDFFQNEDKMHFHRPAVYWPSMHPILPYKERVLDTTRTEMVQIETTSSPPSSASSDENVNI